MRARSVDSRMSTMVTEGALPKGLLGYPREGMLGQVVDCRASGEVDQNARGDKPLRCSRRRVEGVRPVMADTLKSYVRDLLELYAAVLADAAYAYPNLVPSLSKDWDRLTMLARCRGVRFFTVDLPALAKHLERCLATGQYVATGLPGSHRMSRRAPIPDLFGGLYLLVFDASGRLKEDVDVSALFFLRQILLMAKRTELQCSDANTTIEVVDFLRTDDSLPSPSPYWASDRSACAHTFSGFAAEHRYVSRMFRLSKPGLQEEGEIPCSADGCHLLMMLDKVVDVIATTLGPYRPEEWKFKHGPGAVSDLSKGENKYAFANWTSDLDYVFPISDCGFHSHMEWVKQYERSGELKGVTPASRLIAVPKTFTKPRLIAAEPSEHMWCQQNVKHYMYDRCAGSWIARFVTFTDQKQNQRLALVGSRDGSLATVDLSAASDRVTCMCVENTFKRNPLLLDALRASRTRRCRIPNLSEGDEMEIEVKKYSTMGNATTFPVETLVFLAVAITASLWSDGHRDVTISKIRTLAGRVTVFGDDIIVPVKAFGALTLLLEVLDFKVNLAKTFAVGNFRESCGVDAFAGQNITPAYYKGIVSDEPESLVSRIEASNNFYQRLLVNAANQLASTLPGWLKPALVPTDSGVFGLKSFVRPRVPLDRRSRWNEQLQRTEYVINLPYGVVERTSITDQSALLQYFTVRTEPFSCTTGIGRAWMHGEPSQAQNGVVSATATKVRRRWVDVSAFKWAVALSE